jgi:hypothetical protein
MSNLLVLSDDPTEVANLVDDVRSEVRYVVTDFSVELIASKFKEKAEAEGDIYVPDYQRTLVWTDEQASYFIESLILRVPVPPVFLYDVDGRLEIVDGSQRIRSLIRYLNDGFPLSGIEKLNVLNGYRFSDLPLSIQRRLKNTPIRSFVMDHNIDHSTRLELFRRLNTSGQRLKDAEIRKGAYRGPFLDLIIECASSDMFRALTPHMSKKVDAHSERQELVARFFVYSEFYLEFSHDVRKFIDSKIVQFNESLGAGELDVLRSEFERTMMFIKKNYSHGFYRADTRKLVPRVRFEAVAVGTNLALRENANLTARNSRWLRSPDFEDLVRTDASNSAPKLRRRIEYVRDNLLGGANVT